MLSMLWGRIRNMSITSNTCILRGLNSRDSSLFRAGWDTWHRNRTTVFAISDRHNMLFLLFKGDHGAAGEMGLPGRDGNAVRSINCQLSLDTILSCVFWRMANYITWKASASSLIGVFQCRVAQARMGHRDIKDLRYVSNLSPVINHMYEEYFRRGCAEMRVCAFSILTEKETRRITISAKFNIVEQ